MAGEGGLKVSELSEQEQLQGEELRRRIRALLGRSLHIRHVDSGSCNGCDFEMSTLTNPVYDVQRFGIDFVASPRHADMFMVTGGVTRHLEEAVRKTYNHVKQAPDHLLHTIHMGDMNEQRLSLPVEGAEPIINMVPGQIVTKKTVEVVPQEDGYFKANHIYNKIACIERHHNTGRNGVGILKGYGIQNGAIATSVCHDSHNVIVVGDNDADMVLACERIAAIGGGYVIAHGGKIVGELPLEIMGLITNKPHEEVDGKVKEMKEIAYALGVDKRLDPFINLSFLALTVIPEIRVTTRGVVEF